MHPDLGHDPLPAVAGPQAEDLQLQPDDGGTGPGTDGEDMDAENLAVQSQKVQDQDFSLGNVHRLDCNSFVESPIPSSKS